MIEFHKCNQAVISVNMEKKKLIPRFSDEEREHQASIRQDPVGTYSSDLAENKGTNAGIFDITTIPNRQNQDWVKLKIDNNTVRFTAHTIYQWWYQMGRIVYPDSQDLLIIIDDGYIPNEAMYLWKKEIQGLTDKSQLDISVCHFPKITHKWNKIEHGMPSHIMQNWPGKPLIRHEVIVRLI